MLWKCRQSLAHEVFAEVMALECAFDVNDSMQNRKCHNTQKWEFIMRVTKFRAEWRPKGNQGRFLLGRTDGGTTRVTVSDPNEFTAILTLLNSGEKISVSANGIRTGIKHISGK